MLQSDWLSKKERKKELEGHWLRLRAKECGELPLFRNSSLVHRRISKKPSWKLSRTAPEAYDARGDTLLHDRYIVACSVKRSIPHHIYKYLMYLSSFVHEFTNNQLPVGLIAQLVRALHQYHRGHGFESRLSLTFVQGLLLSVAYFIS